MDVSFFRQTGTLYAGNGIMTFQTPKKEMREQKSPNFFICSHLTKNRGIAQKIPSFLFSSCQTIKLRLVLADESAISYFLVLNVITPCQLVKINFYTCEMLYN